MPTTHPIAVHCFVGQRHQKGISVVSSISSNTPRPVFPSASSGQQTEAALKRQIAAKEAEVQETKDKARAEKLAQEIEVLKTKLAALKTK